MIRYKRLGFVELAVTDLERACRFYETMLGLQPAGRGLAGEARFVCGREGSGVVLHAGEAPGLRSIGVMLEDGDQFAPLFARLDGAGVAFEEVGQDERRRRALGRTCRVVDPNIGATFEFYLPGEGAAQPPFEPTLAKIQRLGHVVLGTPDLAAAAGFWRDVFGFRVSDDVEGMLTFFRVPPNPFHHGLAVGRAERNKLHHVNFMVSEVDDIGRAIHRLRAAEVPVVYGPGRHPPSGSMFLYFLDPDGITLEYSFGMEEFPEVGAREPRRFPPVRESLDFWGSPVDPRFAATGAIVPSRVGG